VSQINRRRLRFWKNIGLGYKTPRAAIEGNYIDKKCPFTGNVSIRGRILRGVVISTKMKRTIIVRRDYLHYRKKYNRFEKRHRNIPAHCSPAFLVKEGDIVTIGQCRSCHLLTHTHIHTNTHTHTLTHSLTLSLFVSSSFFFFLVFYSQNLI
jgi:ribosomal protein uS17